MEGNGVSTENMRELEETSVVPDSDQNNGGSSDQVPTQVNEDEEIDVVGVSDRESGSPKDHIDAAKSENAMDEPEVVEKRKRRPRGSKPKSRSLSPVPDFAPVPGDDYDYAGDEHYFDSKVIPLPFENMSEFESCFTLMPPGEKRFVLDHMIHGANVMFGEFRRLNGHLRALNARSGRINKQVQREAEVAASGSDPRLAPRSSKNLDTSVVEAVMELDEADAERILSKKKVTPTMRALLKQQREEKKYLKRMKPDSLGEEDSIGTKDETSPVPE
ncbi:hypothetical protein FO519_005382 [Halicephalobus sp. NKZ332]|nr:hypothetical protein FO519_005382 [Halicephalobus sp. NKZ332]